MKTMKKSKRLMSYLTFFSWDSERLSWRWWLAFSYFFRVEWC